MLGLAKRVKARMLLTSTSEIYGNNPNNPNTRREWAQWLIRHGKGLDLNP